MEYTGKFKKVSVLGAAGKMGSGILFLTAMEITELKLKNKDLQVRLYAIDLSPDGLDGLMKYVAGQALRAAEKKTVLLRKLYADRDDLVENGEIIGQYVQDVLASIRTSTHLSDAYGSTLVFEAIKEDPALKQAVLRDIDAHSQEAPWYFTNTSSIPIGELNTEAGLGGRLIGFHFYNPPAVQKLVELIAPDGTNAALVDFAKDYARNLRKIIVPSHDKAGFIGNGHFMRDALYGIQTAQELAKELGWVQAMVIVNKVSQDFLLRPMGVFQLIDYVGVDVVSFIMGVMNPYLEKEDLHSPLLDELLAKGVKGGQHSDGSQKDGFFVYERGRPVSAYDPVSGAYKPFEPLDKKAAEYLGPLPVPYQWKQVNFAPEKQTMLEEFFTGFHGMNTPGSRLAMAYGLRSREIGQQLVASGVAQSEDDVNRVLETGFYHAYGPINPFFNQ